MKCVFLFLFPDLNVLYCNVVSGIYLSYIYKIRDVHYNSHNNSLTMRIPKNGKSTTIYEKNSEMLPEKSKVVMKIHFN